MSVCIHPVLSYLDVNNGLNNVKIAGSNVKIARGKPTFPCHSKHANFSSKKNIYLKCKASDLAPKQADTDPLKPDWVYLRMSGFNGKWMYQLAAMQVVICLILLGLWKSATTDSRHVRFSLARTNKMSCIKPSCKIAMSAEAFALALYPLPRLP